MTPRDCVLSVYHGSRSEDPAMGIYLRYHRPGAAERRARDRGLALLAPWPVVSLLAPPWHVREGYLSEVQAGGFRVDYRWQHGGRIERRTLETPAGRLTQELRRDDAYQSDWIEKHYLESLEDYEVLEDAVRRSVLVPQEDAVARLRRDLGSDGVVLGRLDRSPFQKLLCELADPQALLLQLMTDPGPIDRLTQTLGERLDEQIDAAVRLDVDAVWQPDNVTAEMTPPWVFERYLEPYYRRLAERCRAAGKPLLIHLDGRLKSLVEPIARCRFDVVESFSLPEMGNDLTLDAALAAWPDKVVCPNVPASLADAEADRVASFVHRVRQAFDGRPLMLQISEDVPLDRLDPLLDTLSSAMELTP